MVLELKQTQKLKLNMTQSLFQAISLLQYNHQEINQYIYQQSLENPLIDIEEPYYKMPTPQFTANVSKSKTDVIEEVTPTKTDFRDDLTDQVRYLDLESEAKKTVLFLILSLDERGYLTVTLEDVQADLNVSEEVAEHALAILQDLEPAGIGARTIQECLSLQLMRRPQRDNLAERLVKDYLDYLIDDLTVLSELLNETQEAIEHAIQTIKQCRPTPIIDNDEPIQYIAPDATVTKKNGQYVVTIEDQWLPKITINHRYYQQMKTASPATAGQYVSQKYKEAQWLIQSLNQRRTTLLSVTDAIIEHQHDFLDYGFASLRPLTLRDLAIRLDIHESTVSRTIKNKYIQTPHGLIPYKRLFATGIQRRNSKAISTDRIKFIIQDFIKHETKTKPLSDQKIVEMLLEKEGIEISRRAVANYRKECGYPSSSKRKLRK